MMRVFDYLDTFGAYAFDPASLLGAWLVAEGLWGSGLQHVGLLCRSSWQLQSKYI